MRLSRNQDPSLGKKRIASMSVRKSASVIAAISSEMASGHSSVQQPPQQRQNRKRKLSVVPSPDAPPPEPDFSFGPPPPPKEEPKEEANPEIHDQEQLLNLRGLLSEKSGSLKRTHGNQSYMTSKSAGKKTSRVKKGCMVDRKID